MTSQNINDLLIAGGNAPEPYQPSNFAKPEDSSRPTHARVKVHIPRDYHQEPVISRLVSHYGLTVNIAAALLGANVRDDGWFDLELLGTRQQIQSALIYFDELNLEIWHKSSSEIDGW